MERLFWDLGDFCMRHEYVHHPMRLSIKEFDEIRSMPLEAAKEMFKDFVRLIPSRMTQLQRIVVLDAASQQWEANFTRESLPSLNTWFLRRIHLNDEGLIDFVPVASVPEGGMPLRRTSHCYLTPCAHSVLIDVGIYWAECLRMAEREFVWERIARPKNHGRLNFPAITGSRLGFQVVPWHSFRIWVGRYFEGWTKRMGHDDTETFIQDYDAVLALPRKGEKGYD